MMIILCRQNHEAEIRAMAAADGAGSHCAVSCCGAGAPVWSLGFWVYGSGLRVWVQGLGLRV